MGIFNRRKTAAGQELDYPLAPWPIAQLTVNGSAVKLMMGGIEYNVASMDQAASIIFEKAAGAGASILCEMTGTEGTVQLVYSPDGEITPRDTTDPAAEAAAVLLMQAPPMETANDDEPNFEEETEPTGDAPAPPASGESAPEPARLVRRIEVTARLLGPAKVRRMI